MAKKRHTAEQIITKLREVEVELAKGQPISKVVRTGSHAPGTPNGVTFSSLGRPVFDVVSGQAAFDASLRGTNVDVNVNRDGIWVHDTISLSLVVREGDQTPGMTDGVTFDKLMPIGDVRA